MLRARDLASSSFRPMEVFLLAAAIYLAMSLPVAMLTRRLEARFGRVLTEERDRASREAALGEEIDIRSEPANQDAVIASGALAQVPDQSQLLALLQSIETWR